MYTADGEFLFKFGSHGEGNGQFNAPTGVAVDTNGNIIVADWGNSRIQVSFRKPHLTESREKILKRFTQPLCAVLPTRCSTAQAPSCPTSTHQQTPFMAPRAWPSHRMVMWWLQTLETTASRSTATCSRDPRQPSSLLQELTVTQQMYSTGCNDLSNTAFWCLHQN